MNAREHRIQSTLSSLENIQKAEVNPFLYAKVENRLQISREVTLKPSLVWSMAACVLVVLSVNIFTLLHFVKSNSEINASVLSSEYFSYTKSIPIL